MIYYSFIALSICYFIRATQTYQYLEILKRNIPPRIFRNVSVGLEYESYINKDNVPCTFSNPDNLSDMKRNLTYRPNRKIQNETIEQALKEEIQMIFVAALGKPYSIRI